MTNGISTRSFAIEASRALSSARSGDPGRYDLTGSLIAAGTRRTAPKEAISDIRPFYKRPKISGPRPTPQSPGPKPQASIMFASGRYADFREAVQPVHDSRVVGTPHRERSARTSSRGSRRGRSARGPRRAAG